MVLVIHRRRTIATCTIVDRKLTWNTILSSSGALDTHIYYTCTTLYYNICGHILYILYTLGAVYCIHVYIYIIMTYVYHVYQMKLQICAHRSVPS